MKNYGQITEDKDIINKKYADTLDASSLHKSGDEVAEGQKTFNGKTLIKNLTLNIERPWTFEQSNTGSNATLDLKSEFDGQQFRITSPLKTKGIGISVSETSDNNWLAPIADNVTDLGRNSYQWRNLYIAGNLSDGTNSVPVSEIVNLADEQTITGLKKFDNAKFRVNDNDYRAPLTSPAVETSYKRYLVGAPALSSKYSNLNASCYMQDGKLYSNGAEVANASELSTVAKTGAYSDLLGIPIVSLSYDGTTLNLTLPSTTTETTTEE